MLGCLLLFFECALYISTCQIIDEQRQAASTKPRTDNSQLYIYLDLSFVFDADIGKISSAARNVEQSSEDT